MIRRDRKEGFYCKASYTLEAAIYIPMVLFLLFQTVNFAIEQWEFRKNREYYEGVYSLDIVSEFYGYQIMKEVGKEVLEDES